MLTGSVIVETDPSVIVQRIAVRVSNYYTTLFCAFSRAQSHSFQCCMLKWLGSLGTGLAMLASLYSRFKYICNRKAARTKTTGVVNLICQRQSLYWTSLYSSIMVVCLAVARVPKFAVPTPHKWDTRFCVSAGWWWSILWAICKASSTISQRKSQMVTAQNIVAVEPEH